MSRLHCNSTLRSVSEFVSLHTSPFLLTQLFWTWGNAVPLSVWCGRRLSESWGEKKNHRENRAWVVSGQWSVSVLRGAVSTFFTELCSPQFHNQRPSVTPDITLLSKRGLGNCPGFKGDAQRTPRALSIFLLQAGSLLHFYYIHGAILVERAGISIT